MKHLCIPLLIWITVNFSNGHAQGILQNDTFGAGVFNQAFGKGQSFTAVDSFTKIGVGLQVFNPPEDRTVSMFLYEGTSLDPATLIATRNLTPQGGAYLDVFWIDFDFSQIPLAPGSQYTFVLGSAGRYWAGQYNYSYLGHWVDYPDGQMLVNSQFKPDRDMRFRVIAVPEPSTSLLLAAGVLFLAFSRFKNSQG